MARITVVDDYPDFVEMMTAVLADGLGNEVSGIGSPEAGLMELPETRPDLMIIDLHVAAGLGIRPGARGDVRAATVFDVVPTIVCSGDLPALRQWTDAFRDRSNVHMLEKPFTLDQLAEVVHRALDERVPDRLNGGVSRQEGPAFAR